MNPSTNLRDPALAGWQYDYYQTGDPAPGALHHVYRVQTDGVTLDTVATYTYDTQGRITRQTTATGAETDYAYYPNGDLWTVTGPANNDLGTRPVTTYALRHPGPRHRRHRPPRPRHHHHLRPPRPRPHRHPPQALPPLAPHLHHHLHL